MGKIIKKLVILVLSLAILAGTLFIEGGIEIETVTTFAKEVTVIPAESVSLVREGEQQAVDAEKTLKVGDKITTDNNQTVNIHFNDNGVIRVASSTTLIFKNEFEDGYLFELEKGRLWVNNLYTSSHLNVLAGGALLMPRRAAFDVAYDGVVTEVSAFSNHVNVGLVDINYNPERIVRFKDDTLINSFLVAQGGQASIHLSKVANNMEILRKLLYSKLIKEFKYSLMDKSALSGDRWISQNLASDDIHLLSVSEDKMDRINSRGLKFGSLGSVGYQIDQVLNSAADVLTFSDEKRLERLIDTVFDHLLDAEYLFEYSRINEAKERLNLFSTNLENQIVGQNEKFKSMAFDKLRWHYADLNYVLPTDDLYPVKVEIGDLLIENLGNSEAEIVEKMELIRVYLNYAFALAETDVLQAKLSLEKYYKMIGEFMKKNGAAIKDVKFLISEDSQIMDNLLKQYSQFYQDSIFAMKYFLESEWLKLLPDGTGKIEEQQTIISTKIDFLKQLQRFFLEEDVSLEDAKKIVLRLINEIQDLETGAEVAVSQLFALRLKDYGNFLRFLNTTSVSVLRGSTPQKAYDDFLAKQKEQVSIEQAISEFFGEEAISRGGVTTDQIVQQVRIDFDAIDVTTLDLGPFAHLDQKYIDVKKGMLDDIEFSARYEWDRKQISQIVVGSKVISQNPIRLANLPLLLKPRKPVEEEDYLMPPPEEIEEIFEQPKESKADQVAKILLLKKLQTFDITVAEENIMISDAEEQMYVVNGAVLLSKPNIQIAFIFDNRQDLVSSLAVRTPFGDKKLESSYQLGDVSRVVTELYEGSTAEEPVEEENE